MPHPPLWVRWLLAIVGFVLLIGVARIVTSGSEAPSSPTKSEREAEVEANREGNVVIEEDQAPHTAPLRAGVPQIAALQDAIAADARGRVRSGQLTGPLQSVHCAGAGPSRGGQRAVHCTVHANGVTYPFIAVIDERTRQLTWCKVDPSPTGGTSVPVSARCRA